MSHTFLHDTEIRCRVTKALADRIDLAAARTRKEPEDILRRAITLGLPQVEAEIRAPIGEVTR